MAGRWPGGSKFGFNRLQKLYQAEINGSIEWFFDGIITVKLGDDINGFKAQETFSEFDDALHWLWTEAKKQYPNCELWKDEEQ